MSDILHNMKQPLVEVRDFSMQFGDTAVIDNLSFSVGRGETFGLLGSNGSGKTTTLRALLGMIQPTSGTLQIDGAPFAVESGIQLGYLPEERGLYKKESVLDVMSYFGQLKGMSRSAANAWSQQFLQRVSLAEKATMRIDKLSGGQQQKIQLGITIMNNPTLLILDEPTKGFDPVNRRLLMEIIAEHQAAGATVIFVSHHMEEVERLCDRILLLKNGTAAAYGSVAAVKKQFGGRSLDDIFVQIYGEGDRGA